MTLLPCPFCGNDRPKWRALKSHKILLQNWHSPEEARYANAEVRCGFCGATISASICFYPRGPEEASKEALFVAATKWNARICAGHEWITVQIPCPDSNPGCLVLHCKTVCKKCGKEKTIHD